MTIENEALDIIENFSRILTHAPLCPMQHLHQPHKSNTLSLQIHHAEQHALLPLTRRIQPPIQL